MRMRPARALTFGTLFLLTCACGGGGGGGAENAQPAQLRGAFCYLEMLHDANQELTEAGPVTVDGQGTLTGQVRPYLSAFGLGDFAPLSPRTLGPGAGLQPLDQRLGGTLHRSGFVSDLGDLALLAAVDGAPALQILARPASGLDEGDVVGTYHFVSFTPSNGGTSIWGRLAFDGQGAASVPAAPMRNVDRVVSTEPNLLGASYDVSGNGDIGVALTFQGGRGPFDRVFQGCVGPGGRLIVSARTDDTGGAQPTVFAALRSATNADLDTFFGRYAIGVLFARPGDPAQASFATFLGTVLADGEGGAVLDGLLQVDSSFQEIAALQGSYSVTSDGTLSLVFPELTLEGGLDESGRLAVLGGDTLSLLTPAFAIVVRAALDNRN